MKTIAFLILLASTTSSYRLVDIQNDEPVGDISSAEIKEEVVKVEADEFENELLESPKEDPKQELIEVQKIVADLQENETLLKAELAYTKDKLNDELSKPKRKKVAYVQLEPVKEQKEESNGFWDWIFHIKQLFFGAAYFLFGLKF